MLRCDPLAADPCADVGSVMCCSDDPIAIDLSDLGSWVLPQYGDGLSVGTPLFSAANNTLSRSGYCLSEETPESVALAEVAAQGCRIPCNPTWSDDDVAAICGPGALCCQTVELQDIDCVYDASLGDGGCFRPVNGADIVGLGGTELTNWAGTSHATHQDPTGISCGNWVDSLPTDLGLDPNDLLVECFRRLTVADQRGSCFAASEIGSCPYAAADYIDACEQQNIDNGYTGCD